MAYPFFTIGHSNRSTDEFIGLLTDSAVQCVADVRTVPRSRSNPQYNADALAAALARSQIGYEHITALGGLRGRQREVPTEVNAFWEHQSFHNYADYAMGEAFRSGLTRLRELGRARPCTIMCAEALWWRCHRRLITDYLIAAGETVFHILGRGDIQKADMTTAARFRGPETLMYPVDA